MTSSVCSQSWASASSSCLQASGTPQSSDMPYNWVFITGGCSGRAV